MDAPRLAADADGAPITRETCAALFTARPHDSHKGSFGTLGVLGGGPGMSGAALLAARAALHLGAGKVLVGFTQAQAPLACDPQQPELMLRSADSLLQDAAGLGVTAWTIGCGMGLSPQAQDWLERACLLAGKRPMVLDADALTLLARATHGMGDASDTTASLLLRALREHDAPLVLTPHAGEAARLLACRPADIQADRSGAARELARRYQAWIVLKGPGSIVCDPTGSWRVNTSGNPGLATAGTGDVLAGILGSLLAQGLSPVDAVPGAVWLHGAAADYLVQRGIGPIGLTAGELIGPARSLRNGATHRPVIPHPSV